MASDELIRDLIKTNLMSLVQTVAIRGGVLRTLTPYQEAVARLADKYGVPSPSDILPGTVLAYERLETR